MSLTLEDCRRKSCIPHVRFLAKAAHILGSIAFSCAHSLTSRIVQSATTPEAMCRRPPRLFHLITIRNLFQFCLGDAQSLVRKKIAHQRHSACITADRLLYDPTDKLTVRVIQCTRGCLQNDARTGQQISRHLERLHASQECHWFFQGRYCVPDSSAA